MTKPIKSFKEKGVSVAVWARDDGSKSYSISKTYKDKNTGEWKDSKYWFKDDVIKLIEFLQEAVRDEAPRNATIDTATAIDDDIPF